MLHPGGPGVSDAANVLSAGQKAGLKRAILKLQRSTRAEMAVVVLADIRSRDSYATSRRLSEAAV